MGTHQEEWEEWNNLFKSKKKKSRNVVVEEGVCADWHWHWHWLGSTGGERTSRSLLIRSLGRVTRADWPMDGRLGRGSPPFAGPCQVIREM